MHISVFLSCPYWQCLLFMLPPGPSFVLYLWLHWKIISAHAWHNFLYNAKHNINQALMQNKRSTDFAKQLHDLPPKTEHHNTPGLFAFFVIMRIKVTTRALVLTVSRIRNQPIEILNTKAITNTKQRNNKKRFWSANQSMLRLNFSDAYKTEAFRSMQTRPSR